MSKIHLKRTAQSSNPMPPPSIFTDDQIQNFTINFNGIPKNIVINSGTTNKRHRVPRMNTYSQTAPSSQQVSLGLQKVVQILGIKPDDLSPELRENLDRILNQQENFNSNQSDGNSIESISEKIDYLNYHPIDLQNCVFDKETIFSGIIRYIFLLSNEKMNIEEISFLYRSKRSGTFPENVIDYKSPNAFGTDSSQCAPYFGIKFNHIKVRPFAYAIQSAKQRYNVNHLSTFLFQAKNENDKKWTTLDEQCNITKLSRACESEIFFVDTDEFYSEFRIYQNGKSHANNYGFDLSGIEIHGDIKETQ
ncbi:hypothetical protein TRFO_12338 [Tritrichomonas foetus]|uniref:Uncharacterized protein n=1 Tax=Tritrichomonas foetus TaxID=1144522 RepID=A0A1J4IZK3_9EUKA|nr:hypothetical protein TRFO_12338 [Tritrichomonas foetus]|eukprot:OHS92776.1 hypothetical protein TRFO_12338 [Tritrichomonas foetus]